MASDGHDLWKAALDDLTDDERQRLKIVGTPGPHVLHDVLATVETKKNECSKKRPKFTWKGKPVILRDVFAKTASWIHRFVEVGDNAVQYDPVHAALPWAAVRFILTAGIADIELYGVLMANTAVIANTIASCEIQGRLYADARLSQRDEIRKAIAVTYLSILKYLCYVLELLHANTVVRMLKATLDAKKRLEEMILGVIQARDDTSRVSHYVEGEKSRMLAENLANFQDEAAAAADLAFQRDRQLLDALQDLRAPLNRIDTTLDALKDSLKREQRVKILQAISQAPYPLHHKTAAKDRLADSGTWLLEKSAYRQWRRSSANSILWLHGIPGSGKTKLTSLVVDTLATREHIAYFYCARNSAEAFRSRADDILASLVRQLSCTKRDGQLFRPVVQRYEDALEGFAQFGDLAWTSEESVEVLLELTPFYPSVTIVIDALDEVDADDRLKLIDAFHELVSRSDTLVKVFVSSRENFDIVSGLSEALDVRIYMYENASDIRAFISDRMSKNTRLASKLDFELWDKVYTALRERAQGMFRLVDLQIQTLSSLKTSKDIEARLHSLPVTLAESYEQIYDEIKASGEYAFALAVATFQFLLRAADSTLAVQNFALLTRHWPGLEGHNYTSEEVRDVCSVFISIDGSSFRFSHLTVREYFESRAKKGDHAYDSNLASSAIAAACLSALLPIYAPACDATGGNLAVDAIGESRLHVTPTSKASFNEHSEVAARIPDRLEKYALAHWWTHVSDCAFGVRKPLHEQQLRHFILERSYDAIPYRKFVQAFDSNFDKESHPEWPHANPLLFLSDIGREDLMQELLEYHPGMSNQWSKGDSPLWYAITKERKDHLRIILRHKPLGLVRSLPPSAFGVLERSLPSFSTVDTMESAFPSDQQDASDLHLVAEGLADQIIQLDGPALEVLVKALGQETDLLRAVEENWVHTTRCLVSRGIGVKYMSKALANAYSYDYVALARTLEEYGATKEKAAVARALRRQLFVTAERLIRAGYEVNGRFFEHYRTPLHYAVHNGRADLVRLLLQHGARVQIYDRDGLQPHHVAARSQQWNCLALLLSHGADVDLPALSGWTIDRDSIPTEVLKRAGIATAATTGVDSPLELPRGSERTDRSSDGAAECLAPPVSSLELSGSADPGPAPPCDNR